jgi:uncharacterized protein with NRDE domain
MRRTGKPSPPHDWTIRLGCPTVNRGICHNSGVCFVLTLFQVNEKHPLILAANRDEARARPSTGPHLWPDTPGIWAGRDEVAGGTWLGVNGAGVLAAITNRAEGRPDLSFPSRGQLCLATLWQPDLSTALATVESDLSVRSYNPFNLLCATVHDGAVITWQNKRRPLTPGIHVLTNHGDLDNPEDAAVPRAFEAVGQIDVAAEDLEPLLVALGKVCADRREPNPICRPEGERGTVSSSLIALDERGQVAGYWHADGPPSSTPYRPIQLGAGARS